MIIDLQETSQEVWAKKYQLVDAHRNPIDKDVHDSNKRVAKALAAFETNPAEWEEKFLWAIENGATPAGRIMSNAGAEEHKPAVSLINCTVSQIIEDSMKGILDGVYKSGLTLAAGCGIGYEFSTLRPKGSYVNGPGAYTSGPLSFMDIYDSMCFTVSSAGGRRGAQMGTFAIWHPDVEDFIQVKREDGRMRQFNLSLLIDDEFMEAVKTDSDYALVFPVKQTEIDRGLVDGELVDKRIFWEKGYCQKQGYVLNDETDTIKCKVYRRLKARDLWDLVMQSTYDFSEPGFLMVDHINDYNNNWFCEKIRATNPCLAGDSVVEVRINGQLQTITMKDLNDLFNQGGHVIEAKSMNTATKQVEFKLVTNSLLTRESAEVLEIEDEETGKKLVCTPDHLIWTENRGYVMAKDLQEDDVLKIS